MVNHTSPVILLVSSPKQRAADIETPSTPCLIIKMFFLQGDEVEPSTICSGLSDVVQLMHLLKGCLSWMQPPSSNRLWAGQGSATVVSHVSDLRQDSHRLAAAGRAMRSEAT